MKSFPSTLNEAQRQYGKSQKNSGSITDVFDIERLTSINLTKNPVVVGTMLNEEKINISEYNSNTYSKLNNIPNPSQISADNLKGNDDSSIYYENPLTLPADIIALAKDYDWIYKYKVKSLIGSPEKNGESLKVNIADTSIVPSMFNPMYGINLFGIIRNTPLLNDTDDDIMNGNTSDCSIRRLCSLSKMTNSPLGQARYKYADFMYCKDLGKVSNNYMITLRKFAHPIGDHIFEMSTPKFIQEDTEHSFKIESDVGRLITWFGIDDNKLEDICKYSYHATWVEKNADIQQEDSKADDPSTGIIGMISNSFNPVYNRAVAAGQAGSHSIWGHLASSISNKTLDGIGKNNGLLRNYDNNKVYTPKNTIQSTHLYEGKLVFSQEFTLNFSYQLRAYDNINPRTALLDLLGNIYEVTYRRGKFWGGERKIIGPAQDLSAFNKTSAFIDNAFDKIGSVFSSLKTNGINMQSVLGAIGSLKNISVDMAGLKESASSLAGQLGDAVKNLFSTSAISEAAKGYIKNALGRPTLYAWHSLLTGDDVGLWHVTIGNPLNPILSIGNLILENSTVTHSGPLGIDDFPTELKVSITLKHARPRDITEIGRMYTKGASAIYNVLAHHPINDFFGAEPQSQVNGTDAKKQADTKNLQLSKEIEKKSVYNDHIDFENAPNPFLETDEHIHIARTNNWSDTMFSMSMEEAA